MLNEIKEFEQYSFDFINNQQARLKYKAFSKGYSGIERALISVARYYLFLEDNKMTSIIPKAEQRALTAIKLWCGGKEPPTDDETEIVRDWLPKYIRYTFLNDYVQHFKENERKNKKFSNEISEIIDRISDACSEDDLKDISNELKEIKKNMTNASLYNNWISPIDRCIDLYVDLVTIRRKYGKHMFKFEITKQEDNDLKALTYEKIIANAFIKGPLKRYYLCCDDCNLIDQFDIKDRDTVLKTIASYLLNKNKTSPEQEWTYFNKTDVVNWLKDISKTDDFKLDTSIFQTQKVAGNTLKLRVKDDFLKHFKIVEENELKKRDWKNGIFFRDDGSHSYLVENTIY